MSEENNEVVVELKTDMNAFMDKEFPVEGADKPPVVDPEKETVISTEEPPVVDPDKPPVVDSDKPPVVDPNLPPDFGKEKPSYLLAGTDVDISDADIEKAIENETDENKKVNMARMRTKLQAQSKELSGRDSILSQLREAQIIDESNNVIVKIADPEMEQKLADAYDKIGTFSLAEDPRFKERFIKPINQAGELFVNTIAGFIGEGDDAKKQASDLLQEIIALPPHQQMAVLSERAPDAISFASPHLAEISRLFTVRNQAMKDHQATLERISEDSVIEESTRVAQLQEALKTKVLTELRSEGVELLSHKPGNDEYNAYVDKILDDVDVLFKKTDIETQSKYLTMGRLMPVFKGMYEATSQRLAAVEAELAKYKKTGVPANGVVTHTGDDLDLSDNEKIIKHIAGGSA